MIGVVTAQKVKSKVVRLRGMEVVSVASRPGVDSSRSFVDWWRVWRYPVLGGVVLLVLLVLSFVFSGGDVVTGGGGVETASSAITAESAAAGVDGALGFVVQHLDLVVLLVVLSFIIGVFTKLSNAFRGD